MRDRPGAGMGGRSVIAKPFDARELGTAVALLRAPVSKAPSALDALLGQGPPPPT